MWFWLSIICLLCWSGSDIFSKIGCRDSRDQNSHLKMVMAVGLVMGLHACYEIFVGGAEISLDIMLTYLPVSMLYILSMTMGYIGLRYIELSISSPICNASGALVAAIILFTEGAGDFGALGVLAVVLVGAGVIGLGVAEAREDSDLRAARQESSNFKYAKSPLALILPLMYCVLDAAGTFADSLVLQTLNEDSANVAYELTFFVCGLACFVYLVLVKKERFVLANEKPKYVGAIFETAGQFAYIYALSDTEHVMFAAPIISSYCVASVIWSRLFLKEKLSKKHYTAILTVIVGIVIMGILDL